MFEYDYGKEKIKHLKGSEIRKMADAPNAVELMLIARAEYKAFVVASYLLGNQEDFEGSLRLLEKAAKSVTPENFMPQRPRFVEEILGDSV